MYQRILVAVENSEADRTILAHVARLAKLTGAELLLVHVADGWAARHFDDLKLRESEEMKTELARGDPATGLIRAATEHNADLIAMSTHGHRFISDVILGATADRVRHL